MHEKEISELKKQLVDEHARYEGIREQLELSKKLLSDQQSSLQVVLAFKIKFREDARVFH